MRWSLPFSVVVLHVEYAERSIQYGILFRLSLFYEYINLEYVRIHDIYRVNQAEYVIRIRVAASQEEVNTYSTRRVVVRCGSSAGEVVPWVVSASPGGWAYLGLHKILFYFEAFAHESIILSLPPPTCIARTIATLLHVYCAIYDAPPTPLVYAIHNTILIMAISCKGQAYPGRRIPSTPSAGAPARGHWAPGDRKR